MKRFLNIEMSGEGNIGVIHLSNELKQPSETEIISHIKDVVPTKLMIALETHFDAEVEIKSVEVVSAFPPLQVKAKASFKQDGVNFTQVVELNETWVY